MSLRFAWLAGASLIAAVTAGTAQAASPLDLVAPVSEYKLYVSQGVDQLVKDTKTFTDAVKAGDLAKAKALYAPTRVSYEKIEPIAELFSDLDGSIDSRADDHEKSEEYRHADSVVEMPGGRHLRARAGWRVRGVSGAQSVPRERRRSERAACRVSGVDRGAQRAA